MNARTEHMLVEKTARYYVLGEASSATREVWICCHGFGQLAGRFIREFESIVTPERVVVAPEGLHRFYLDPPDRPAADRRVGATWMTRDDREFDIADYLRYLDQLCTHLRNVIAGDAQVIAFGFSQGTATVARWAGATDHVLTRLILWGSLLPPDLDWPQAEPRLQRLQLTLVTGEADAYVTAQQLADQEADLRARSITFQTVRFDGGHHMDQDTLRRVSKA